MTNETKKGAAAGPFGPGQRWSLSRKREVVLRLLKGEPLDALSRELGVDPHGGGALERRRVAIVEPIMPASRKKGFGTEGKWHRRDIVDAIFCVTRTGCSWRGICLALRRQSPLDRFVARLLTRVWLLTEGGR